MVLATTTPSTATTCSARVGFYADEWTEMPLACSASVGITRYTDKHGIERAYCRHHRGVVQYRYPPAPPSAECRFCHRPLTGDDWQTFSDRGAIFAACGPCIDKAE